MTALALVLLAALPAEQLAASDGTSRSLAAEVAAHDFTVVLFFSAECPVVRSHDARIIALAKIFPQVHFLAVDAQATATLEGAKASVEKRSYPFPMVVDAKGTWADALGVRFSATVVVLERAGRVRYFGGIDDRRVETSPTAKPFLESALEKLLAGKEPEPSTTRPLGCVLKRP
jgi:hypothetical protein